MKKTLLIAAVIAALGLGGWFAYAQTQNSDKGIGDDQSQNAQTPTPPATNDPSEGGKYLVIKEWGVRFPKTEMLQDLIYYYDPVNKPKSVFFGIKALANKYPGCSPENVGLSIVLARSQISNDAPPSEPIVKFGDYFYSISGGGASCVPSDTYNDDLKLLGEARGELSRAMSNLEEVK